MQRSIKREAKSPVSSFTVLPLTVEHFPKATGLCCALDFSSCRFGPTPAIRQRKRVLGIMAARKFCQLESTRPSPALHSIIADAVIFAERIMQRIDAEWPTPRTAA
jgi:hypothetical protein